MRCRQQLLSDCDRGQDQRRGVAGDAADVVHRATDAAGNVQPDVPPWNRLGYGNDAVEVSYVDAR